MFCFTAVLVVEFPAATDQSGIKMQGPAAPLRQWSCSSLVAGASMLQQNPMGDSSGHDLAGQIAASYL